MLYDLIQVRRGKEIVMMTDTRTKVQDRMKTLRASHRKGVNGEKVQYSIRPSEDEKFKRKPHTQAWRAGGYSDGPKKAN